MSDAPESLGRRLQRFREGLRMSKQKFARTLEVSASAVARWEANIHVPNHLACVGVRKLAQTYNHPDPLALEELAVHETDAPFWRAAYERQRNQCHTLRGALADFEGRLERCEAALGLDVPAPLWRPAPPVPDDVAD